MACLCACVHVCVPLGGWRIALSILKGGCQILFGVFFVNKAGGGYSSNLLKVLRQENNFCKGGEGVPPNFANLFTAKKQVLFVQKH